jgi:hypothetical protein
VPVQSSKRELLSRWPELVARLGPAAPSPPALGRGSRVGLEALGIGLKSASLISLEPVLLIGVPWGMEEGLPAGEGLRLERGMGSELAIGRLPRRGSGPLSRSRRRAPTSGWVRDAPVL